MKKHLLSIGFYCLSNLACSQARIVMNNDANMVIHNGSYLVIDNVNANAITLAGTGGKIKSEAEENRVRWKIGSSTGLYTIPFADDLIEGGTKIPFTMNIVSAGSGSGYFDFSTYDGDNWNNHTYMPSMVTHMGQYNFPNTINHSAKVIDRFWILNPIGYSVNPTSSLIFTYIDDEHSKTGNLLIESNMGAQRFNNNSDLWGDMLPIGTINTSLNTLTTSFINPSDLFSTWTLTSITDPLSVDLLNFTALCDKQQVYLNWKTASEKNSSYFQIYKSTDMDNWKVLCQIFSSGNSSVMNS